MRSPSHRPGDVHIGRFAEDGDQRETEVLQEVFHLFDGLAIGARLLHDVRRPCGRRVRMLSSSESSAGCFLPASGFGFGSGLRSFFVSGLGAVSALAIAGFGSGLGGDLRACCVSSLGITPVVGAGSFVLATVRPPPDMLTTISTMARQATTIPPAMYHGNKFRFCVELPA